MAGVERCAVRAPATISGLGLGPGVLALALAEPTDRVLAARAPHDRVHVAVAGPATPADARDPRHEAAGAAATIVRRRAGREAIGIELTLEKSVPLGAGLGSAAASVAAAAYATNHLLGSPLRRAELVACCIEAIDTLGGLGAENAAAAMLGGLVALRTSAQGRVPVRVPLPSSLWIAVIVPPHGFPAPPPRHDRPWTHAAGDLAGLVGAGHADDVGTFGACIRPDEHDTLAAAAMAAGALGAGRCGVGHAVFACAHARPAAERARDAVVAAMGDRASHAPRSYVFVADHPGVRLDPAATA